MVFKNHQGLSLSEYCSFSCKDISATTQKTI